MNVLRAVLNITTEPSAQRNHIERAADIGKTYTAKVQGETSDLVFTQEGRRKMTRKHATVALKDLDSLLAKSNATQTAELTAAAETNVRAMNTFAPPYSREPWGAIFDVEMAKALRHNTAIVTMMAEACRNGADIDPAYGDHARAALRAPLGLTGVTAKDQNAIVASLIGVDLVGAAFASASDAKLMIRNVTTSVCSDAEIRLPELASMHRDLAELLAKGAGELGKPQPDAPNVNHAAAVSSTVPLVTGDKVHDGFSAEAVA